MAEFWNDYWWAICLLIIVLPGVRWVKRRKSDRED